jgi:hypothetical protein
VRACRRAAPRAACLRPVARRGPRAPRARAGGTGQPPGR